MYKVYSYKFKMLIKYINHYIILRFNHIFNSTVKKQIADYKLIPIIIISYNQLSNLKKLITFLTDRGYDNIIIVDNNSDYPPLISYFNSLHNNSIKLYRLSENRGHLSFWDYKDLVEKYTKGYYVITDPDVIPVEDCPENFLETFMRLLDEAYSRTKVGFSLMLDDIPVKNPNRKSIMKWESKYFDVKVKENVYKAPIDTTFALYRPNYKYKLKGFTNAWRTGFPLQARHGGWYLDIENLTEEQDYYINSANKSASWLINKKGELSNSEYKRLYND